MPSLAFEVVKTNSRPLLLIAWADSKAGIKVPEHILHAYLEPWPGAVACTRYNLSDPASWPTITSKVLKWLLMEKTGRVVLLTANMFACGMEPLDVGVNQQRDASQSANSHRRP